MSSKVRFIAKFGRGQLKKTYPALVNFCQRSKMLSLVVTVAFQKLTVEHSNLPSKEVTTSGTGGAGSNSGLPEAPTK